MSSAVKVWGHADQYELTDVQRGRSGSDLLLYSYSNPPFAYIGVKRNGQYGRLLAQLHGNLTPAHADGCAAQCFEGVQRGSIIVLPVRRRPQVATLVLQPGLIAPLFPMGKASWRTCRTARHRQNVSVCPMMRRYIRAYFSKNCDATDLLLAGKG